MKKIIISAATIFIASMQAQQIIAVSGADAVGTGGSSSYTIGQVAYLNQQSAGFTIEEGVQHSYEFISLSTENHSGEQLEIKLYPNPVKDFLYLHMGKKPEANMKYQLFDAQGKLMLQNRLNSIKNEIDMRTFPQSVYIIRIFRENTTLKTIKIIKN
ncbi:MAG: hypothetical protein BGO40_00050 [Chryseobacterium sp. 39-10]|nr:T9SS type A sorting domain-containing protein [Chryseobacterium sp.]OJV49285.1 MAG: hypothetical protein BGO40_00050 [Chryseobacterium sp. 39-10]